MLEKMGKVVPGKAPRRKGKVTIEIEGAGRA